MIDANLIQTTLPANWYIDPNHLQHERDAIFHQSWLFVGHLCEFAQAGSFVTRQIMRQNVFVIRGKDGELRGFYNVCLHRAHELLVGNGVANTIVCPYHNWAYRTDGRLQKATNARHVPDFDPSQFCLQSVRVEVCGQLVFVNLADDAPSLASITTGLAEQIAVEYPDISSAEMQLIDQSSWTVQANWKVDVENFLECYHCSPVHTQFCNVFEVKTQRATLFDHFIFHYAEPKPLTRAAYSYDPTIDPKRLCTWTLFPNTMIYLMPGEPSIGIMVATPHPTDPNQSVFWATTYAPNAETAMIPALVDVMETTMQEDFAIIESVQRGLHSKGFEQGVLLVDRILSEKSEHTVAHFQRYVRSRMALVSV